MHHGSTNSHGLPGWSSIRREETSLRLQMAREMQTEKGMPEERRFIERIVTDSQYLSRYVEIFNNRSINDLNVM